MWANIEANIAKAPWDVDQLPADDARSRAVMDQLELTEDSELGALAANTGGLVADHGWVRILAAGCGDLPDVATASPFTRDDPKYLVLAVDVIGGIFAIDGGALGSSPGRICYFDPARLEWSDLNVSHAQFMAWVLTGDVDKFYDGHRWDGWKDEVSALSPSQGLALDPSPAASRDLEPDQVTRTPAPLAELWRKYFDDAGLAIPAPAGF